MTQDQNTTLKTSPFRILKRPSRAQALNKSLLLFGGTKKKEKDTQNGTVPASESGGRAMAEWRQKHWPCLGEGLVKSWHKGTWGLLRLDT